MGETREEVVSDEERNTGIYDNVNKVMDCNQKDSCDFGSPKPIFLEIYKDLLFSEQINSSKIFSVPSVLNTGTSSSHNASNISIRSTSTSVDLSLDTRDEEILNIFEVLQCSADKRLAGRCNIQRRLTSKFVSDTVFNLNNNVLNDTEIRA